MTLIEVRYMDAKRVLAAAGMVRLTPWQIGFLKAVRWPVGMGPDADRAGQFPATNDAEVPA